MLMPCAFGFSFSRSWFSNGAILPGIVRSVLEVRSGARCPPCTNRFGWPERLQQDLTREFPF